MTETMLAVLHWLIPSGGVGAIVVWLTNKRIRKVRTEKEVHETYKVLYENIQQTLIDLQDENKKLYARLSRLERSVTKSFSCRHYDVCPVRRELQKYGAELNHSASGFVDVQRKANHKARDDPYESGGIDDSDEPPA